MYTIIKKPSMIVVGIDCRTSNAPEAAPYDIPKLWEQFYSQDILSRIPSKISSDIIALYCDYENDHTGSYSLVIGCQVSVADLHTKGLVTKIIPSTSYAVFRAVGDHPKTLIETWGKIWQQADLKRTYTGDYEVYGDQFLKSPQELDVFIAIQ